MTVPQSRKVYVIRDAFLSSLLRTLEKENENKDWHNRDPKIWIEHEDFPGMMFKAVIELDPREEEAK